MLGLGSLLRTTSGLENPRGQPTGRSWGNLQGCIGLACVWEFDPGSFGIAKHGQILEKSDVGSEEVCRPIFTERWKNGKGKQLCRNILLHSGLVNYNFHYLRLINVRWFPSFPYFRLICGRWFPALKIEKFLGFTKFPFHVFVDRYAIHIQAFGDVFLLKIYHFPILIFPNSYEN